MEKIKIIWYNKKEIKSKREEKWFALKKNITNNINPVLNEFISRVKILLGKRLKKIILYGSYARGDYNDYSDIDIMILTDFSDMEIEEYRDKISDIAFDIELNTGYIISPILRNIDIFNMRTNYIPFYQNVEQEGVVLIG